MKYEVQHSLLSGPSKSFRRGDVVDAEQLTAEGAGFDVEFLLRNGAIEPLKGTEGHALGGAAVPTTTADAHPSQATAPDGNRADADKPAARKQTAAVQAPTNPAPAKAPPAK